MEIELRRSYVRLGQYIALDIITEMYPVGHPVRQALLLADREEIMDKLGKELDRQYPMPKEEIKEVA